MVAELPPRTIEGQRLKYLTGGEKLKARLMRRNEVEWAPTHAMLLAGNTSDRPALSNAEDGLRRRLVLMPFHGKPGRPLEREALDAQLDAEAPAFLRWIIEVPECQPDSDGPLGLPPSLAALRDGYLEAERSAANPLADFLADACVREAGAWEASNDLLAAYRSWADAEGVAAPARVSRPAFSRLLAREGFDPRRQRPGVGKRTRGWMGLALKDEFRPAN